MPLVRTKCDNVFFSTFFLLFSAERRELSEISSSDREKSKENMKHRGAGLFYAFYSLFRLFARYDPILFFLRYIGCEKHANLNPVNKKRGVCVLCLFYVCFSYVRKLRPFKIGLSAIYCHLCNRKLWTSNKSFNCTYSQLNDR